MSHTPPGWYSEEDGHHEYWDGGQWDERMTPSKVAVEADEFEQSEQSVVAERHMPLSSESIGGREHTPRSGAVARLWQHVSGTHRS